MTVRVYRSSDASAPALRGNTPGDLINLLDKCLVAGYGAKTAAGWTKPYTGTNVAAFRQGTGSNGMYLRVDDTSTAAANRGARVTGYEAMSDVNTGTPSPFPTSLQVSGGGMWWTKYTSSTAANAREWILMADEKLFYLWIDNYPEQTTQEYNNGFYAFGDIETYKTGDSTHTILLADPSETSPPTSSPQIFSNQSGLTQSHGRLFIARRFDQLGSPASMGWHSDYVKQQTNMCGGTVSYPHGPDGGLLMAPVYIHDPTVAPQNIRGFMPGLWAHCHPSTILAHLDRFDGQGDFTGKSFQYFRGGSICGILVEISDTWR